MKNKVVLLEILDATFDWLIIVLAALCVTYFVLYVSIDLLHRSRIIKFNHSCSYSSRMVVIRDYHRLEQNLAQIDKGDNRISVSNDSNITTYSIYISNFRDPFFDVIFWCPQCFDISIRHSDNTVESYYSYLSPKRNRFYEEEIYAGACSYEKYNFWKFAIPFIINNSDQFFLFRLPMFLVFLVIVRLIIKENK